MAHLPLAYFSLNWQGALELEILCSSDFLVDGFKLYRDYFRVIVGDWLSSTSSILLHHPV